MLKEVVASNAAKLIAACVCPVVGTAAVTLGVPEVRQAVHKATAPKAKPVRTARAKPRVRAPAETAAAPTQIICPDPVMLTNMPLSTPWLQPTAPTVAAPRPDQVSFAAPPRVPPGPVLGGGFVIGGGGGVPGGGGGGGGGETPPDGGGTDLPPPPPPPDLEIPPAVPEPATWAQLVVGFGALGGATRLIWKHRVRKAEALARG